MGLIRGGLFQTTTAEFRLMYMPTVCPRNQSMQLNGNTEPNSAVFRMTEFGWKLCARKSRV